MVKQILKNNGITLLQFAEDMNISRPTLDSYIKTFEKGDTITNDLFQNIFEFLFSNPTITEIEFESKYDYVNNYYGLKSKMPSEEEVVIPKASNKNDGNSFIQDSVKKNSIIDDYYDYKNGKKQIEHLTDKEKKYFSVLFKAESEMDLHNYSYDTKDLENFINYSKEKFSKEHPEEYISDIVKDKVDKIISSHKGLSIEQILLKLKEEL